MDNDYFVLSLKKGLQFSKRIAKERCHEMEVFLKSSDILNAGGDSSDSIPGILIRTKTASLENQEVSDHLKAFLEEWNQLLQSAKHRTCFTCLKKKEGFTFNTVLNSFVDLREFDEIITDEPKIMKELEDFATKNQKAIRLYEDKAFPLSGLYGLTSKMDDAINTRVWLKSGAYLVIEHTEALTTIDVNTGKNESHKAMSDVQFNVNLEAAEEIAVQLRLRNLSGIIIVDFINCKDDEQKHALLKKLRDLVKEDIVPTKVIDMTPLGLVEITRKKVLKPLREQYFKEKSI